MAIALLGGDKLAQYTVANIHIGLYLLLLGITLFRHRLSFRVRSVILIEIMLVMLLSGVIDIDRARFEIISLFIAVITTISIFSRKDGLYTSVISVISAIVVSLVFFTGLYGCNFNVALYATDPSSWILIITMFGILLSLTISRLTLRNNLPD